MCNTVLVCLDPVSSGSHQWGSEWPDKSHPATALSSSLQAQGNAALHFRGLTVRCSMNVHICLYVSMWWLCALLSVQDYVAAMEDFQQSLELKKNQPIAMLYKGLTFFHRGMLKVSCSQSHIPSMALSISKINKQCDITHWLMNYCLEDSWPPPSHFIVTRYDHR